MQSRSGKTMCTHSFANLHSNGGNMALKAVLGYDANGPLRFSGALPCVPTHRLDVICCVFTFGADHLGM
ncbi:hypothetical protein AFLA_000420 [Aspergillus flavus NRRL3357]|nr:hypothetical protein AFLA_000420 [Aspergillus flavus NRRL3357]